MEYTQNTYVSIIDTIRKEVAEKAESLSYDKSRKIFREQLSAICAEYGCQFLGFNLIRMLHKKKIHVDIQVNNDEISICGHIFDKENIAKPSAISNEDKEKYAHILAQVTCATGNWPMTEELAAARFCTLLKDNLYLEDDLKTTREIERKDLLNVARGLALSYQDTNELLFRTLECGVLTDTSAADLIERFIIENKQSVSEREKMLTEYTARAPHKKASIDKRKDNITQIVRDTFYEKIISTDEVSCYDDRRSLCLDYLVKNARFLDAPNRTAASIYTRLLICIRDTMNGEYDEITDEKAIFKRLRAALITSRTDWSLSKEEQISLVQELLASEDCDTLNEAYTSWSIPSIHAGEEKLGKIELGTRMEHIVTGDGDIQIQKKDLLFALFLACSLAWEGTEETDIDVLRARLDRFINLSNELLRKAYIENERLYLAHPMESSIATAIMCGSLAEGVFRDVTENLKLLGDRIRTNSELSRTKLPPKVPGETARLPQINPEEEADYDKLHDSVMTAMHQLRHGINDENNKNRNKILYEAADIAQKIRDIWKRHNFRSIEIYFHPNGTWGFIPTASIGKDYKEVGNTPKGIQEILYGNQKLKVIFCRPVGAGKYKYITLQEWIDEDTPKLDAARVATLHRKAVMYIILGQLEVFCDQDIIRINNEPRDFDFSELISKYGGDEKNSDDKNEDAQEKETTVQKLVLQCNAQVMGRRFMKIRGVSMATLEITDKPKPKEKNN